MSYHHFIVYPDQRIEYDIIINHGTLICITDAELDELQEEDDNQITRRVIIFINIGSFIHLACLYKLFIY
jgi:hypothetical protein